ncbi:tRNA adenosine(34) deaminase TadA [Parachlamydia sp. AcF125]|uniref:tRNA adenosine(34) deaminase TadA n=1 Tax=Parachlamydia sp. AcF125 TaxID=2795736 RepID=UPI001BC98236|nr:tRNA adenosine(34) deaminase TadA [Parachlamydia sp. AcF125]MBS4169229.1 tRNA-specific adenosine deaminase [Parachlamydia sp. AcF125]
MSAFPFAIIPQDEDEKFMLEALKQAWKAFQAKEVPVGAVLVYQGKVIARGYNQVELLRDATAHAEVLCITAGEAALSNWRLGQCKLYCTIEPCAMCAGAMLLSRVEELVWGAPDIRHGANGSWVNLLNIPHPTHQIKVKSGILKEPCASLMKQFFQMRRLENTKVNGISQGELETG